MWHYQKHPKNTPKWLTRTVLLLGGSIGLAIGIEFIYMFYAFAPVLGVLFLGVQPAGYEPILWYGAVGCLAALSGASLVVMALAMNSLQRIALRRSIIAAAFAAITSVTTGVVWFMSAGQYIGGAWVALTLAACLFGAVAPMIGLHTPAGKRLHSRH